MGVLGLTPFLQRYYPSVVKQLPNRLQGFDGKTIVFDGTLITHRFHYAPSPYPFRHVLGWYRLITELRVNNVNAICVFDGAGRSDAKLLEHEKRQNSRRLDLARWNIEVKRYNRLRSLRSLVDEARRQSMDKRTLAIAKLEGMLAQKRDRSKETSPIPAPPEIEEDIKGQPVTLESSVEEYEADIAPEHEDQVYAPADHIDSGNVFSVDEPDVTDQDFLFQDERPPSLTHYDFTEKLEKLYASHEESSRTIQAITPPTDESIVSPEEVTESRKQLSLTSDEDILWSEVQSLIAQPQLPRTPPLLADLIQRSKSLCESYKLRASWPEEETFEESKMILEALGVPCIEARGEYEAEGLAATLVRRGLAHFVASEDTDVLVYGAPLLRNITSGGGPIVSISSAEVRRALGVSRAAFLDFALLIGTDFVPRLRNVGPVRALGFIHEHARIERVVKNEIRYTPGNVPDYLKRIRQARKIFTSLPPVPPKHELRPGKVDTQRATELLNQFGLARVATEDDWDPDASFRGNYFNDNPFDEGLANAVFGVRFFK